MAWTKPLYTRGDIQRAGMVLIDNAASSDQRRAAIATVNNWRSSHGFPLNTLQVSLRDRTMKIDSSALIAQRIKRLPSIINKLDRYPTMNVARMQDLGGCRAVLSDVNGVSSVVDAFLGARTQHRLVRHDNYLLVPKPSGYRGVHLIYSYRSERNETWNNLSIEVQVRSQLQHAWATAVETVGLFTNQALKSSIGESDWLHFFQTMSSAIALREGLPVVEGTSSDPVQLQKELRELSERLNVVDRLESYARLLQQTEEHMTNAKFVLLTLDIPNSRLVMRGYRRQDDAALAYAEIESQSALDAGIDVVLVAVSSMTGLRSAYPNYFLDTTRFVQVLKETLR